MIRGYSPGPQDLYTAWEPGWIQAGSRISGPGNHLCAVLRCVPVVLSVSYQQGDESQLPGSKVLFIPHFYFMHERICVRAPPAAARAIFHLGAGSPPQFPAGL